ncbi:hypothetical protein [Scytonema sp. NUACC26]|uniref:hypothetical protein n=1 Tax=Scytonema sp. NUACC26 TaxID=3140176 RepID=UPI0034DB8D93
MEVGVGVGVVVGVADGLLPFGFFRLLGFVVGEVVGLGEDVVVGVGDADDGCALASEVKLVAGIAKAIPLVRAIATNFVILFISHLTRV